MNDKVRKKGRRIGLLLAGMMALILLSGCGAREEKGVTGPVTITIWHDKEEAVAEVLQLQLDTLAPDILVKLEKKEGLTDALKLVGNDPASAPDMYFFAHDKIGVYAEMGILSPITEFLSDEVLEGYLEVTRKAAAYKGELYQLPIYYETLLFMYNKDLMDAGAVPETTGELYVYMQEHTKEGHYGFVEQHSTAYYSVPWIHGFGGSLIDETGTPQLTSDAVINALKYHLLFLPYMPGESEYSTVNTLFLEGYAHSTIGGPWLVPTAREAGIDLGFAPMPVVEETGLPLAPYSGVQGIHVLKIAGEAKREAVTKVLECIADPGLGTSMALISGCAPAASVCYENEQVAGDEMIMTMKQTAETAVPMPNIPEMDVMFVVAGNLLVEVNMKGTAVEEAAANYQKKAETLIEAMK